MGVTEVRKEQRENAVANGIDSFLAVITQSRKEESSGLGVGAASVVLVIKYWTFPIELSLTVDNIFH